MLLRSIGKFGEMSLIGETLIVSEAKSPIVFAWRKLDSENWTAWGMGP